MSAKPHVSFFLPNMKLGGAERAVAILAKSLASEGAQVDLVLVKAEGELLAELSPPIRVIDLASDRMSGSILKLAKYLRAERPQAVCSQMFDTTAFAAAAIRLSGIPVRLSSTIHSTLSVQARESEIYSIRGMKRRLTRIVSTWVHQRWVDTIIAVSEGVADDFSQFTAIPRERIKVIYNPVDVDDLTEKARAAVDHPWLAPGMQDPVVVAVGNLKAAKAYDNLIAAFSLVVKNMSARLVIVGEGSEREPLERLVKDLRLKAYVDLVGAKTNPYPYMAACDLFVLSSRREGAPTVLVEALALGKKIVATNCQCGPAEILQNGRYGVLVKEGDINELASAILSSLSSHNGSAASEKRLF